MSRGNIQAKEDPRWGAGDHRPFVDARLAMENKYIIQKSELKFNIWSNGYGQLK